MTFKPSLPGDLMWVWWLAKNFARRESCLLSPVKNMGVPVYVMVVNKRRKFCFFFVGNRGIDQGWGKVKKWLCADCWLSMVFLFHKKPFEEMKEGVADKTPVQTHGVRTSGF
jgi:hypothetical protein